MGYIHKTTTLFLLFMLMIALMAFGASTLFYQRSLERLNTQLTDNTNRVNRLENTLESLAGNYSLLQQKYDIKTGQEQELSSKYTDIKSDKETLEMTNEEISLELNDTIWRLNRALLNISNQENKINNLNEEVFYLEDEMDLLTEQYDQIMDDIEDVCQKIEGTMNVSECEDY